MSDSTQDDSKWLTDKQLDQVLQRAEGGQMTGASIANAAKDWK